MNFQWIFQTPSVNFPWNLAHFKNSIVRSRIFSRELGWSLAMVLGSCHVFLAKNVVKIVLSGQLCLFLSGIHQVAASGLGLYCCIMNVNTAYRPRKFCFALLVKWKMCLFIKVWDAIQHLVWRLQQTCCHGRSIQCREVEDRNVLHDADLQVPHEVSPVWQSLWNKDRPSGIQSQVLMLLHTQTNATILRSYFK